ncbi:putative inner membrane peptidase [Alcanivorax hongdengensis A-11-3]|uniref:Putative inner membrane peptidase n=1 Tax=Alcanivorax hongdengensis A-11-3 TaxID=1177179 RepID=L0WDN4_9GAMM|nr:protease SohB [Alcanivorax hongdengensis]EKF74908.1 putative inner membrane peptidase [Alcanivorax hongdengensis A-11-3]
MIEFLTEYGMFLAKVATLVVAVLFVVGGIIAAASRNKGRADQDGDLKVRYLNDELDELKDSLEDAILPAAARKKALKEKKKQEKAQAKQKKKAGTEEKSKPRLFVLDFNGDIQASGVEHLRREISAVLQVASAADEILLRLESPGGLVHSYGLAASQLRRIRNQGIKLTIAVDQVAASGGYMMACIADRIISAPFAIIGSIGVVAQIPNFHRLLKKNDIDVELMTAGEYKRTLTMLGENTDKARAKFQQELEETHTLFKSFVRDNRRSLDLDKVATGEHWFGSQAKELGLVDELMTSDELLQLRKDSQEIYQVEWHTKRKLADRLGFSMETALNRVLDRWLHRGSQRQLY